MAEKRFYWLKLKENYLNEPKIKKLRKKEKSMFSKDRKIEILTAEVERLRRENNMLKDRDTKEIAKKAQEISDEYIKETQDNLDEIIELKEKYHKLIDELEDVREGYEKEMKRFMEEIGKRKNKRKFLRR